MTLQVFLNTFYYLVSAYSSLSTNLLTQVVHLLKNLHIHTEYPITKVRQINLTFGNLTLKMIKTRELKFTLKLSPHAIYSF